MPTHYDRMAAPGAPYAPGQAPDMSGLQRGPKPRIAPQRTLRAPDIYQGARGYGSFAAGPDVPDGVRTPEFYTSGCEVAADDLAEAALDDSIAEALVTPQSRSAAIREITDKGLFIEYDPVVRNYLKASDEAIIAARGDVIGGELVDKLRKHHKRVQAASYHGATHQYAPGQPLLTRYEQEIHNNKFMEDEAHVQQTIFNFRHDKYVFVTSAESREAVDIPKGPAVLFDEPLSRKAPDWESAQDVWESDPRIQKQIWGIQRAPTLDLNREADAWQTRNNPELIKRKLREARAQFASAKEAGEDTTAIVAKGRELADTLKALESGQILNPRTQDAPKGLWTLDNMQQKAFGSKKEADAWIRTHQPTNPGVTFKPYRHLRPAVTAPKSPRGKGPKRRERAGGLSHHDYITLRWRPRSGSHDVTSYTFPATELDAARNMYQKLAATGRKPTFAWATAEQNTMLTAKGKQQVAAVAPKKPPTERLALTIGDRQYIYDVGMLPTVRRAATTAASRGKQVKLQRVKTDAPVTRPNFVVRQSQKIKTKDGEEIPYTYPVSEGSEPRLRQLFADDPDEPQFVRGLVL